jgi:spore maturation protein CgeB
VKVTILGLSITSSWGNGHATNYRALARALHERGDEVVFLERNAPWYAAHRDLPAPPWGLTHLYDSVAGLRADHAKDVASADLVIVGSFVPDGVEVAEWACSQAGGAVAFYDIDTPVTLEKLASGDRTYLAPELIPRFDLYLSFTAGPALQILAERYGARRPEPFFCFVDGETYAPLAVERRWELSYLGTYSAGRQPALQELLLEPAQRRPKLHFAVAGPMYPPDIRWPENVQRIEHLPPGEHPGFYCASALTLNVTRPEMRALGHSPSVRLFEAAACATAIISDVWDGLDDVLAPESEILLAHSSEDVLDALARPAEELARIGAAARRRVLAEHTAERRAERLHELLAEGALR